VFAGLRSFVDFLEEKGQLVRVGHPLSPAFEIPAALASIARKTGKACRFTSVVGYNSEVVGGVLGTRERLAMALGVEGDVIEEYYYRRQYVVEPRLVSEGPVQEVVVEGNLDILKEMPVLTHHELDAGPYLTSAVTVTKDPDTGARAMGIHRVQVKGPNKVSIFAGSPPVSECLAKAEARGEPLEIAIVVGLDPLTFLASVVRAPGTDKFAIAGALARQPIELVKCRSVSLEVPARAEFVLEGQFIPGVREREGPFGESTGYYLTYDNPVARITTLTHRRAPLYQALMPFGGGEEEVLIGVTWEGEILRAAQAVLPQVRKVHLRHVGLVAFVQIEKRSDEDSSRVFDLLLSLNPSVKVVVVVDEDVDPYDFRDVEWAIATRCQPDEDISIRADGVALSIDPSHKEGGRSSKVCIDATRPFGGPPDRFRKVAIPREAVEKAQRAVSAALGQRRSASFRV